MVFSLQISNPGLKIDWIQSSKLESRHVASATQALMGDKKKMKVCFYFNFLYWKSNPIRHIKLWLEGKMKKRKGAVSCCPLSAWHLKNKSYNIHYYMQSL